MTTRQIILEIPEKVLLAEKTGEAAFAQELRILAAVKLYEMGRLSYLYRVGIVDWLPNLFDEVRM